MYIGRSRVSYILTVEWSEGFYHVYSTIIIQSEGIGTSITIVLCYYTTLPYHILLSIARYAGVYRHDGGPCGEGCRADQHLI